MSKNAPIFFYVLFNSNNGKMKFHLCYFLQKDDDTSSVNSGSSSQSYKGKKQRPTQNVALELMEDMEVEIAQDKNPLVTLARAAKMMNPTQFELPKDVAPTMNMPGLFRSQK